MNIESQIEQLAAAAEATTADATHAIQRVTAALEATGVAADVAEQSVQRFMAVYDPATRNNAARKLYNKGRKAQEKATAQQLLKERSTLPSVRDYYAFVMHVAENVEDTTTTPAAPATPEGASAK